MKFDFLTYLYHHYECYVPLLTKSILGFLHQFGVKQKKSMMIFDEFSPKRSSDMYLSFLNFIGTCHMHLHMSSSNGMWKWILRDSNICFKTFLSFEYWMHSYFIFRSEDNMYNIWRKFIKCQSIPNFMSVVSKYDSEKCA